MQMVAPCKGCEDRKIGCHGQCERYQEYAKTRHELSKKREAANDVLRTDKGWFDRRERKYMRYGRK